MRRLFLILLLIVSVCFWGCESRESTPPQPQSDDFEASEKTAEDTSPKNARFLQNPLQTTVVEHPAEALPLWRAHKDARPTLLLISNDPFLAPIPNPIANEAMQLVLEGAEDEVIKKSSPQTPDPLLMPSMAVTAALRAGFFSKVVWLLPNDADRADLSTETFRRQLLDYGAVSEEDAFSFRLENDGFHGTIQNVPWVAVPFRRFAGTDSPVVVHFDLSLIKPLYRNEVKTPLYPLLGNLLTPLREAGLIPLEISLSLSQVTGQVPLDTRFIGQDLAQIIARPDLLDQDLPRQWRRRSDVLYLQNFFQRKKILEHYLEMSTADPQDASVQYGLYQISRMMKNEDKALEHLKQAVMLDSVYGMEYLGLSRAAQHKAHQEVALALINNALAAFPQNPFVLHRKVRLLLELGRMDQARGLLQELKDIPWSPIYYPQLPDLLNEEIEKTVHRP